jgi:hypothetical protein
MQVPVAGEVLCDSGCHGYEEAQQIGHLHGIFELARAPERKERVVLFVAKDTNSK